MKPLTVKELIAELQKFPEDAEVYTEGCDCYGEAVTVDWFGDSVWDRVGNAVIISRSAKSEAKTAAVKENGKKGGRPRKTPSLVDGEPCGHAGCLQHVSHPCEGCGRIAGKQP